MKKPNVIFLVVDGLRQDRIYGKNKTANTPNIDKLIRNGCYFSQVISPADGTTLSLNGIFNGLYPYKTGIRQKRMVLTENNFLKKIKDSGYEFYSIMPKFTSLTPLSEESSNNETWFDPGPPTESISGDLGDRIIKMINDDQKETPWFFYVHIFDLHAPLIVPKKFDNEEFGSNKYDKIISSIDAWLERLVKKMNMENTLFILTADHGTHLPVDDKDITSFEPEFQTTISLGKKVIPKSLQPSGAKTILGIKKAIRNIRLVSANKDLTSYEKRSRLPYFTLSLYDESIRVPLLFSGTSVPKNIIDQQISSIDIFPTICDLIGLKYENHSQGKSRVPNMKGENGEETPIWIHSMPYEKESEQDIVGIRTSSYKYFRFSRDQNKLVNLYNLQEDPFENNNVASENPEIVKEMENILSNFESDDELKENELDGDELSPDELKEIQEELKKHGYI